MSRRPMTGAARRTIFSQTSFVGRPSTYAVEIMIENHVHHLPVIDDHGKLLGIVAQSNLGGG